MSLSLTEIRAVVDELRPVLAGGRLDNAVQNGPTTLVLSFYAQRAKQHLVLAVEPRFARIHATAERPPGTGEVPSFVRSVRQGLRGRSLLSLDVADGDRIVELVFGRPDAPAGRLVAELTGRSSNLYHVGPTGHIVAALRSTRKSERALRPGSSYETPAPAPASSSAARDRFAEAVRSGQAATYGEAVERHYEAAEGTDRVRALRTSLAAHLKAARKRAARLLVNLEADIATPEEADHLRLCGELLKLHLADIRPRQPSITVPNVFDPEAPDVEVRLHVTLSPRDNMERYFRRYKKLVAARKQTQQRVADTRRRLDDIDRTALAVQEAESLEQLQALAAQLGHGPKPQQPRPHSGPASGHLRFVSADGLDILVGKTNAGNDELTFRVARGNDMWLHVEGYTGSHVVLRVPKGKTAPRDTLLDAATLAVHFSQLRKAGGGPVAYCACRDVTKPRGARPGQVLYSQNKVLHIAVEPERLARLMRREK